MTKKRVKSVALLAVGAIGALSAAVASLSEPVKADAYKLTQNAFSSRNMLFEESARLENSAYSDSRNGLRISGKQGSYVGTKGAMAGKLDFSYAPENNLTKVTLTFTDVGSKEAFDLVTKFDTEYITSYVECEGEKIGYYYANGVLKQGTKAYSETGVYTRVENGYGAINVSFDPETMQVSVNEKVVWGLHEDFSDGARVGFRLDNFETYTMQMKFSEAKNNASALLYEINGNKLDSVVLLSNVAPRLFADFEYDGVAGEKYTLPKANVYDFVDGLLPTESCSVSVSLGNKKIQIENGAFVPETVGEYKIVYTAKNEAGVTATGLYMLNVKENFDGELLFDGRIPQAELGVHTVGQFPKVEYRNQSIDATEKIGVSAEIFLNGTSVQKIDDATAGFEYVFESAGEYKIVYAPVHTYFAKDVYEIEISVKDGLIGYELDGVLEEAYDTTDAVKIPSMTMKTPSGDLVADSCVRFPDGSLFANKTVRPEQAGNYEIVYTAKQGESVYQVTLTFQVLVAPQALFTATGKVNMYNGAFKYNENYTGLVVEMEDGGSIAYNNVIDLKEYNYKTNQEDSLLFELVVEPSKLFLADFLDLDFVLTDIYDPTNTITIVLEAAERKPEASWGTLRVGHGTQPTVGLEGYTDDLHYPQGGSRVHTEKHGFYLNSALNGKPNSGTTHGLITVKIYFDYETKSVYSYSEVGGRRFIADLDHEAYFDKAWQGFTTGECTLTMTPRNYVENTAKFVLLNVDGQDFTSHSYADTVAPKLYVDAPMAEGTVCPQGIVGKEFPLFDATAIDGVDGVVGVKTNVYYKYGTSLFDINVKDGKFIPELEGEYLLEYVAYDSAGNQSRRSYCINVYEESYYTENPLFVEWEESYTTQTVAGTLVSTAKAESFGGGVGLVDCTVSVRDGNGDEIEVSNKGTFRPLTEGKYTVAYTLSDYIGTQKEYSYTIQVVANNGVIFLSEKVEFPKAILSSIEYELPQISVLDYASGTAAEKLAVISLKDQSGKTLPVYDGKLIVTDKSVTMVTVRYTCPDRAELYKEYQIPVSQIFDEKGLLVYTSYFYGEQVKIAQEEDNIALTTNTQGASVDFLKSVMMNRLHLVLSVDETKAENFQAFSVIFSDSENADVAVKICVEKNGDGATATINGGNTMAMLGSFTGKSNYRLTFRYKHATHTFVDVNTNTIGIAKTCINGEQFNGFPSGKVNIRIIFEDISGEVGLSVREINGQSFKAEDEDREDFNVPDLLYDKTLGGLYALNTKVVLPSFKSADVLGNSDCMVTVKFKNRPIKDDNGNTLDEAPYYEGMSFTLTEIGDYTINYTVKDYFWRDTVDFDNKEYGNEKTQKLPTVSVRDDQSPMISWNGNVPTTAKVGEKIVLPNVTVSDNGGVDKLTVAMFYITPNNYMEYVPESEGAYTFTPKEKGSYTVKCVVFDEYFNYAEIVATIQIG